MHALALRRSLLSVLCVAFIAPACSGQASSAQAGASPTATMNAYYDALKKKDVAAVKKTVSIGYLKLLESAGARMTLAEIERISNYLREIETDDKRMKKQFADLATTEGSFHPTEIPIGF